MPNAFLAAVIQKDKFLYIKIEEEQVQSLESCPLQALKDRLTQSAEWQDAPKKFLATASRKFTLIPDDIFDPEIQEKYLPGTHAKQIDADLISNWSVKNVYKRLISFKPTFSSDQHIFSYITPAFGHQYRDRPQVVSAHVFSNLIWLSYYQDGQLHYANSFLFQSSEDFLYFLLLLYRQFDLSHNTVPVVLSGEITEDSEIHNLICRYIRSIEFATLKKLQNGMERSRLPNHAFYLFDCMMR